MHIPAEMNKVCVNKPCDAVTVFSYICSFFGFEKLAQTQEVMHHFRVPAEQLLHHFRMLKPLFMHHFRHRTAKKMHHFGIRQNDKER